MTENVKAIKKTIFYIAIYMRLSREDGDKEESDSIANQRKMLTNYIDQQKNFIIYQEYVDDGYSGTNFNRPGFRQMLTGIEDGKINCVIVKDLSRFGRDYIDSGYYLERFFVDNEIRFIALNDNIDSFVADYDMLMPVKNVFNAQYARDISRKVQSSFKVKQQAGEFIGAFTSYGYLKDPCDRHRLIIDSYAATIVMRVFELYAQGNGKIRIAHILNDEDILCPSEYKKLSGLKYFNGMRLETTSYWTYSTIHRMLKNEMYIGNMVQGKTKRRMKGKAKLLEPEDWIVVKNTHESIISKELWDKTQNLLNREIKHINYENVSVFSGFVKCGDCGRSLAKKYRYNTNKHQTTKRKPYYVCGGYTRYGKQICTQHKIEYDELESILITDMRTIIKSIEDIKQLVESQKTNKPNPINTTKAQKETIVKELSKVQKLKKDIYEDYKEGLLTKEEYISYKNNYCEREKMLLLKKEDLIQKEKAPITQEIFESSWIKRLISMQLIDKLDRDILAEMIESIIVYENKRVKIIYNFSDELNHLFQSSIDINKN